MFIFTHKSLKKLPEATVGFANGGTLNTEGLAIVGIGTPNGGGIPGVGGIKPGGGIPYCDIEVVNDPEPVGIAADTLFDDGGQLPD